MWLNRRKLVSLLLCATVALVGTVVPGISPTVSRAYGPNPTLVRGSNCITHTLSVGSFYRVNIFQRQCSDDFVITPELLDRLGAPVAELPPFGRVVQIYQAGWPFRSVWASRAFVGRGDPYEVGALGWIVSGAISLGTTNEGKPLLFIWKPQVVGFAANYAIFFAASAAAARLVLGLRSLRSKIVRRSRRKCGRCLGCGYALDKCRHSDTCPECGNVAGTSS